MGSARDQQGANRSDGRGSNDRQSVKTESSMSRRRLLFLCQTLPYPPDGGVWIRTYHVLRLLARAFDITALCFERAGSAGSTNDHDGPRKALSQLAEVEV